MIRRTTVNMMSNLDRSINGSSSCLQTAASKPQAKRNSGIDPRVLHMALAKGPTSVISLNIILEELIKFARARTKSGEKNFIHGDQHDDLAPRDASD
mmetsp:Transcript_9213/g.15789  ORF Transcript_9213/g.15789 Transcript_9213/m.15789 type:complete len:97 (+) Transcript_9213:116-406(+)